jgi:hypothetical protein
MTHPTEQTRPSESTRTEEGTEADAPHKPDGRRRRRKEAFADDLKSMPNVREHEREMGKRGARQMG